MKRKSVVGLQEPRIGPIQFKVFLIAKCPKNLLSFTMKSRMNKKWRKFTVVKDVSSENLKIKYSNASKQLSKELRVNLEMFPKTSACKIKQISSFRP